MSTLVSLETTGLLWGCDMLDYNYSGLLWGGMLDYWVVYEDTNLLLLHSVILHNMCMYNYITMILHYLSCYIQLINYMQKQ